MTNTTKEDDLGLFLGYSMSNNGVYLINESVKKNFKRHVLASSSVLHSLLPDRRDNDTVSSLRNPKPFHTIQARESFINYCLDKYT